MLSKYQSTSWNILGKGFYGSEESNDADGYLAYLEKSSSQKGRIELIR